MRCRGQGPFRIDRHGARCNLCREEWCNQIHHVDIFEGESTFGVGHGRGVEPEGTSIQLKASASREETERVGAVREGAAIVRDLLDAEADAVAEVVERRARGGRDADNR